MASPDSISAIRNAQKLAASKGETLNYRDAKAQLRAGPQVDASDAKIAQLQADLAATKADLAGIRIVGPGHSGQGPKGLMFKPSDADGGGGGGTGVSGGPINIVATVLDSLGNIEAHVLTVSGSDQGTYSE